MIYECCWSANDPESWRTIDGSDAEDAAETYVERICSDDCDNYKSFESGERITVRDASTKEHLGVFTVTGERYWHFHARPSKGGRA